MRAITLLSVFIVAGHLLSPAADTAALVQDFAGRQNASLFMSSLSRIDAFNAEATSNHEQITMIVERLHSYPESFGPMAAEAAALRRGYTALGDDLTRKEGLRAQIEAGVSVAEEVAALQQRVAQDSAATEQVRESVITFYFEGAKQEFVRGMTERGVSRAIAEDYRDRIFVRAPNADYVIDTTALPASITLLAGGLNGRTSVGIDKFKSGEAAYRFGCVTANSIFGTQSCRELDGRCMSGEKPCGRYGGYSTGNRPTSDRDMPNDSTTRGDLVDHRAS